MVFYGQPQTQNHSYYIKLPKLRYPLDFEKTKLATCNLVPRIQTQRQASFVNVSGWRSLKTRTKFELSQILVVILFKF